MPGRIIEIDAETLRNMNEYLASAPGEHPECIDPDGHPLFESGCTFGNGISMRLAVYPPGNREDSFLAVGILEDDRGILATKRRDRLEGTWTLTDGKRDYTLEAAERGREEEAMREADQQVIRKKAVIDGVRIEVEGLRDVTVNEAKNYMEYIGKDLAEGRRLSTLTIRKHGEDDVALDYLVKAQPMERIRRITGYLVGTIDRWNNAKQAEERDRVKHIHANDNVR